MRRICTFDIYGTLFDMGTVKRVLDESLPEPGEFYQLWRFKLVQYLMILSATDRFEDLTTLRRKAYEFCEKELTPGLPEEVKEEFMKASLYLDPFDDVHEGLERLREGEIEVVAFSTGTMKDLLTMFESAGLEDAFDAVISCEGAQVYKPFKSAYLYAARQLEADPSQIRMVAAHPWDLIGAHYAGFKQAWLRRPVFHGLESSAYDTIDPAPDMVADDLPSLAEKIVAAERP